MEKIISIEHIQNSEVTKIDSYRIDSVRFVVCISVVHAIMRTKRFAFITIII